MKKLCILLVVMLSVSFTGCAKLETKKLVDKTISAIENGDYEDALRYGESAIEKGNENEEFKNLVRVLDWYHVVNSWLKDGRVMHAEEAYNKITGYEDTLMEDAVEALETAIEEEKEKIKEEIETLEEYIQSTYYDNAATLAEELLAKDLSDAQKETVKDLLTQAYRGQNGKNPSPSPAKTPTSTPAPTPGIEINITPEQAEQFARNTLQLPANAVVTVTLYGEYYLVNATTDYGDFQDEVGCKVHVGDGTIYDIAG